MRPPLTPFGSICVLWAEFAVGWVCIMVAQVRGSSTAVGIKQLRTAKFGGSCSGGRPCEPKRSIKSLGSSDLVIHDWCFNDQNVAIKYQGQYSKLQAAVEDFVRTVQTLGEHGAEGAPAVAIFGSFPYEHVGAASGDTDPGCASYCIVERLSIVRLLANPLLAVGPSLAR